MRGSCWIAAVVLRLTAGAMAGDAYTVKLDPEARSLPATGRLMLFFTPVEGNWPRREPIGGPFYSSPQPIASIAVEGWQPGDSAVLDGEALAYPDSLDALDGQYRVQALLDADNTERSHRIGPSR